MTKLDYFVQVLSALLSNPKVTGDWTGSHISNSEIQRITALADEVMDDVNIDLDDK